MVRSLKWLGWAATSAGLAVACGGSSFTSGGSNTDGGSGGTTGASGSTGTSGGDSSTSSSSGSSGASGGSSSGAGSGASSGTGGTSSSGAGSTSSGTGTTSGTSSGDSSSGSGTASGGGDGGPMPLCPLKAPSAGASCTAGQEAVTCEWGTANVPSCDQEATCTAGVWEFATPGTDCTDWSGCPTSAGTGTCGENGAYCDYPTERCECSIGEPPTAMPYWHCEDPGGGCPVPRPRLGTPCTSGAAIIVCDYGGNCNEITGGVDEECNGEIWVQTKSSGLCD